MISHIYDRNKENAHWAWLRLQLPPEGVGSVYPNAKECLSRLADVRWPNGAICKRCGKGDPRSLTTRDVYECRRCKHHFSVKAGTVFHRCRIPLNIWFQSAELLIQRSPDGPIVADFENRFQLKRAAATRMRRIILEDLRIGGAQFMGRLIFTRPAIPPEGVELYSLVFVGWLKELIHERGMRIHI